MCCLHKHTVTLYTTNNRCDFDVWIAITIQFSLWSNYKKCWYKVRLKSFHSLLHSQGFSISTRIAEFDLWTSGLLSVVSFHPNVTTLRSGLAVAIPLSVVCLSACLSLTLVHPTQGVEAFGNISSPLCTLAILWPPCKILRRLSQGNPSPESVKRKSGIKLERFWTCRRLYLINGTESEHVSGAENGAERAENWVSGSVAVSGRAKNDGAGAERGAGASENGNGAVSGLNWPLKCDMLLVMLYKLYFASCQKSTINGNSNFNRPILFLNSEFRCLCPNSYHTQTTHNRNVSNSKSAQSNLGTGPRRGSCARRWLA